MVAKNVFVVLNCIVLLYSCEKIIEINNHEEDLTGEWRHTDIIPSGPHETGYKYFDVVSTISFETDAKYALEIDYYGFKDENPNEIIGSSKTLGNYQIRADSVFIKSLQNTSWEKEFNPEPYTVLYEDAKSSGSRFEINDNILTLYYISYPADAPVQTQMSYERVD